MLVWTKVVAVWMERELINDSSTPVKESQSEMEASSPPEKPLADR